MVDWGFMTLRLSTESREPSFGGDGLRNRMPTGLSFGNKNMPSTGRITLECQGKSEAPIFGTLPGIIKTLFSTIVFGKFEQGILLDFRRIIGNRNPTFIGMNLQISKVTQTTKVSF